MYITILYRFYLDRAVQNYITGHMRHVGLLLAMRWNIRLEKSICSMFVQVEIQVQSWTVKSESNMATL